MLDVEHRSLACGFSAGHWRLGAQSWRLPQHFGDVNGFFAYMSLLPQGGAVVVLANAFGLPVERLARELAQLSMGEEGLPVLSAEAPQARALADGFAPGTTWPRTAAVWTCWRAVRVRACCCAAGAAMAWPCATPCAPRPWPTRP